jgi:YaiO family outer membrane protein
MKKRLFFVVMFHITGWVALGQDTAIDNDLVLSKAQIAIEANQRETARELLLSLKNNDLNDDQKYEFQRLLKKASRHLVSVNYELISFGDNYPIQKSWNSVAASYQYNTSKNTFVGTVTYSDRFVSDDVLYELDAYPILSNKAYAYFSVAASQGTFFQKFGTAASLYYNVGNGFEPEIGVRYFEFENDSFFTFITGITKYVGDFYINGTVSLGPDRNDQLVQNYQVTVRYYSVNAADYVFARLGTGISPDDTTRFTQVVANPSLKAFNVSAGFVKWVNQLKVGVTAGYLNQELTNNENGVQLLGAVNLGYRFY